jgi:hypothetical protein
MDWFPFLLALGLTILVEGLMMLALYRRLDFAYYTVLGNLLTNPALNVLVALGVYVAGPTAYGPVLGALELLAVLVEAYVLRMLCRWKTGHAVGISLLLNAASFGAGFLVFRLLS